MSSVDLHHSPSLSLGDLAGDRGRTRREALMGRLFQGAALVSVLISVLIVFSLVREAIEFLTSVELGTLWTSGWFPRRGLFDVKTLIFGSLIIAAVAMLIAVPIGLASAVYLSEYARPRVRRVVKPALEVLAGIPSVVLGVFALLWLSPQIMQRFFDAQVFSLGAAGIGVGILTIPLVASVSEDALRAVPQSLREASYGMGAKKVTTVVRVVVPAAISGLVAALILAVSRAIGETMVVAIAAGGTGGSLFTLDPSGPGQTMTAAMAALASGTDQVAGQGNAYQSLFFVGFMLFAFTLVLNVIADRVVRRVRERY